MGLMALVIMAHNPIEFAKSLRLKAAQLQDKSKELMQLAANIEANALFISDKGDVTKLTPLVPSSGKPPTAEEIRQYLKGKTGERVRRLAAHFGCPE
jgi:hypothetical protein